MKFDCKPAFPLRKDEATELTQRQLIAALALQGILSRTDTPINDSTYGLTAASAIRSADALIDELCKSHD